MLKYPTITDATLVPLRAIELQLKENPNMLNTGECPYSPSVKLFLDRLVGGGGGGGVGAGSGREYTDDDILQEISDLYTELKRVTFRAGEVTSGDSKDQVGVLKTASDLLTKLVDLKAKAMSVRDMSRFQKAVVGMLEDVVTPAQRSDLIERMGAYVQ